MASCGRNSRFDGIQDAVPNGKLKRLDGDNDRRREVARAYMEGIKHPDIILPQVKDWKAHVFHLFPIRCRERDRLQAYLQEHGIQALIHYPIPAHKQKCYAECNNLSFPITEQIAEEELSLPISQMMPIDDIKHIIEIINNYL